MSVWAARTDEVGVVRLLWLYGGGVYKSSLPPANQSGVACQTQPHRPDAHFPSNHPARRRAAATLHPTEDQPYSPFFALPRELRDEVYSFAFSPDYDAPPDYPDDDEPIPHSSEVAMPRLTCRRMSAEARTIVFRENIHVLNLFNCRRSYARPGQCLNRLFNIENSLVRELRRIALYAVVADAPELLGVLQSHFRHTWSYARNLRELRIILDAPYVTSSSWRAARIRAENQVCHDVAHLSNVEMVVVQNILYHPESDFAGNTNMRRWHVLAYEDDDDRINDDR
ncbi:hypothetical protein BKA63DRAFT_541787 [Paraphoma chrysanthemicola]|nr:hypothetical protein BKA63DRAFT_541787 [Paraphoma chrysanthemicola]